MDLSLIYELQTIDPSEKSVKRTFDEALEQVQFADELGYRTVWATEHHFLPRFSYSSAPELFLAAVAMKTKRIRLGHGIVLLPFSINHPLRVAERIATLDVLSNGRVEFGGGRAIGEAELTAFGVHPDATRAQWEEALQMLPKIWTEETFSWKSPTLVIPERAVIPKPMQKPHPPMWVAATQPSTIEFAAKNGLGVLGFGIGHMGSSEYIDNYRKAIKHATPIGKFTNNRFALWVTAMCAEEDKVALDIQCPNVRTYLEHSHALHAPWLNGKAPHSYQWHYEHFGQLYEQVKNVDIQDVIKVGLGSACIGSPESCLKILQRMSDAGVDEALLFMQSFTTPHAAIMRSIELFAKEVKPRIKPLSGVA